MIPVTIDVLPGGREPERREDSVGWDCFSRVELVVDPLRKANVPLGFRAAWDPRHGLGEGEGQWGAFLFDRGKTGNRGILRLAGVIEGTYRNEWVALLHNTTFDPFEVAAGDRVIQFVLLLCGDVELIRAGGGELPESTRGEGGFGSTEQIREVVKRLRTNGWRAELGRALEITRELGYGEEIAKAAVALWDSIP